MRNIILSTFILILINLIHSNEPIINQDNYIKTFDGKIHLSTNQSLSRWHQRKSSINTKIPFSEQHLISTTWFIPLDDPVKFSNALLVFFSDGIFWYGTYQNGAYISGNYELKDSKVRLYNIKDLINEEGWKLESIFYTNDDIKLDIVTFPSYNYSYSLENKNGNLKFAADGSYPEINEQIEIWGYKSIYLDSEGIISNKTKTYISANTNENNIYTKEFSCLQLINNDDGTQEYKYINSVAEVNPNEKIKIIAKSINFNSYFCRVPVVDEYYSSIYAWIPKENVIVNK